MVLVLSIAFPPWVVDGPRPVTSLAVDGFVLRRSAWALCRYRLRVAIPTSSACLAHTPALLRLAQDPCRRETGAIGSQQSSGINNKQAQSMEHRQIQCSKPPVHPFRCRSRHRRMLGDHGRVDDPASSLSLTSFFFFFYQLKDVRICFLLPLLFLLLLFVPFHHHK